MLRNYFKIAWRNIVKGKFFAAVNIIGLSTGITFTLIIAAYVWTQLQVNKQLANADQQYIIQSDWKNANRGFPLATFGPLAKELKEQYPNLVKNYYRFDGITSIVSKGDKNFRENLQIGDSTLLIMYGFKLLHGDANTAMKEPFSVLITQNVAKKYFGKTDVVGETVSIESFAGSKHEFKVTGVLDKLPKNSVTNLSDEYPGNFYIPTTNVDFFGRNMDWSNPYIVNYVELQKGVQPHDLDVAINHLKKNAPATIAADLTPRLVSLKEFYLSKNNGLVRKMIYALSAIALFILIMAIINYINMSVSRSANRMREIGVRKVLGGLKRQLMIQFLVESFILVAISMAVAFALYSVTKDLFSNILGSEIPPLYHFPASYFIIPILFIIFIGLLSGIYPAFVLASLKSVDSLKGKLASIKDNVLLRKSLISFQFVTATVAFVGAIVISQQLKLFLNGNLGYNKELVLSAQVPRDWTRPGVDKMEMIRDQLAAIPQVEEISLSYEVPDGKNSGSVSLYKYGSDSAQAITVTSLISDEKYPDVYHIPVKAGSFFDGHAQDSGKIVLNENAVAAFGFNSSQDAIGQQVRIPGDQTVFTIKGVLQDFHFGSLQQQISPIVFFNVQFATIFRYISIKIKPGNIAGSVDAIQKQWQALMPGAPFEYNFMDDTLRNLYQTEIQLKQAAYVAAMLAFIIVLLGVAGLVSLSIQKRTKEIGIRKVLGSSVPSLLLLFVKEFLMVVLIGGAIACPLAWFIMHGWLQGYAYRVDLTATPFVVSIACLGSITAVFICVQTIRTALANPVKSLRTE